MESKEQREGQETPKKINVELCEELLRAAERGDTERVKELLQSEGVDARFALMEYGVQKTPLLLACEKGHQETARVLLEHGGETQEDLGLAFCDAACNGHVAVVKLLLERGVDPAWRDNLAVCVAAQCGNCEVVKLLLSDPRVDPAADDNLAVRWAAEHGHCEVVKVLLIDPRVDPAADNNYAVRWAAQNGHCEVLELLLADHRVDGTRGIPKANSCALPVLFEDERCGIGVNRALFEQHHRREVLRYDELIAERTVRICAVSWGMKQIGEGWGDLREPMEERMQRQPVDWDWK